MQSICPFCKYPLFESRGYIGYWKEYFCNNDICEISNMTSYMYALDEKYNMISLSFIIDQYHIDVYIDNNMTIISKLDYCFLVDPIQINSVVDFDMNDLVSVLSKVKTLVLFS